MEAFFTKLKNLFIIYLFGLFGVHKFLGGNKKWGFIYLFTLGLFGFGWLFDLVACLFYPGDYIHKNKEGKNRATVQLENSKNNSYVYTSTPIKKNEYYSYTTTKQEKPETMKNNLLSSYSDDSSQNKREESSKIIIQEIIDEYVLDRVIDKEKSIYRSPYADVLKTDRYYAYTLLCEKGDELYKSIEEYVDKDDYKIKTYTKSISGNTATIEFLIYKKIEFSDNIKVVDEDYSLVYLNSSERERGLIYANAGDNLELEENDDERIVVFDRKIGYELGEISKRDSRVVREYLDNEALIIKTTLLSKKDKTSRHPKEIIINIKAYDINKYLHPRIVEREEAFCNDIVDRAILENNVMGMFEIDHSEQEYSSLVYDDKEVFRISLDFYNSWAGIYVPDEIKGELKHSKLFIDCNEEENYWFVDVKEDNKEQIKEEALRCIVQNANR